MRRRGRSSVYRTTAMSSSSSGSASTDRRSSGEEHVQDLVGEPGRREEDAQGRPLARASSPTSSRSSRLAVVSGSSPARDRRRGARAGTCRSRAGTAGPGTRRPRRRGRLITTAPGMLHHLAGRDSALLGQRDLVHAQADDPALDTPRANSAPQAICSGVLLPRIAGGRSLAHVPAPSAVRPRRVLRSHEDQLQHQLRTAARARPGLTCSSGLCTCIMPALRFTVGRPRALRMLASEPPPPSADRGSSPRSATAALLSRTTGDRP